LLALDAPAGAYNVADDLPCSQNAVIEYASGMLGLEPPPLLSLEAANLSAMARSFYAENRRVANGKAKRMLGWRPRYPSYHEGLAACLAARQRDQ
jgi:nucleoside-diphosphate-sugar epimerase